MVRDLSNDLMSLSEILDRIITLTQDQSKDVFVIPLKDSLERCIGALKELQSSIKPYVRALQNGEVKWKRVVWTFEEKEVVPLQVRLSSCRDNL
jgi:hypothetical protein